MDLSSGSGDDDGFDDRSAVVALFSRLKGDLAVLESLLEACSSEWVSNDIGK